MVIIDVNDVDIVYRILYSKIYSIKKILILCLLSKKQLILVDFLNINDNNI